MRRACKCDLGTMSAMSLATRHHRRAESIEKGPLQGPEDTMSVSAPRLPSSFKRLVRPGSKPCKRPGRPCPCSIGSENPRHERRITGRQALGNDRQALLRPPTWSPNRPTSPCDGPTCPGQGTDKLSCKADKISQGLGKSLVRGCWCPTSPDSPWTRSRTLPSWPKRPDLRTGSSGRWLNPPDPAAAGPCARRRAAARRAARRGCFAWPTFIVYCEYR